MSILHINWAVKLVKTAVSAVSCGDFNVEESLQHKHIGGIKLVFLSDLCEELP